MFSRLHSAFLVNVFQTASRWAVCFSFILVCCIIAEQMVCCSISTDGRILFLPIVQLCPCLAWWSLLTDCFIKFVGCIAFVSCGPATRWELWVQPLVPCYCAGLFISAWFMQFGVLLSCSVWLLVPLPYMRDVHAFYLLCILLSWYSVYV